MHIQQLLTKRFGSVRSTSGRNGTEYVVTCCFCSGKGKLYINPTYASGVYNCYKCNRSGKLEELLEIPTSVTIVKENVVTKPLPIHVPLPGETFPINELDESNQGVNYLTKQRKRKFDLQELHLLYDVQYCSTGRSYDMGEFTYNTSNTLVFPVIMNERLIGWQSRLLYDPKSVSDANCMALGYKLNDAGTIVRPPKYWTSPGFQKGKILYNFDKAREYPYVVVTEGVFDVFAVGPCAVATFGTGISHDQVNLLKTYWDKVILLLDPDAHDKTAALVTELRRSVSVVAVNLGDSDAGDMERVAIWKKINEELQVSNGG